MFGLLLMGTPEIGRMKTDYPLELESNSMKML